MADGQGGRGAGGGGNCDRSQAVSEKTSAGDCSANKTQKSKKEQQPWQPWLWGEPSLSENRQTCSGLCVFCSGSSDGIFESEK